MSTYDFLISFKIYTLDGVMIRAGSMKCKNKSSENAAKVGLEAHLKKQFPAARRIVLHSCRNLTLEEADKDILYWAQKVSPKKAPPTKVESKPSFTRLFGHE